MPACMRIQPPVASCAGKARSSMIPAAVRTGLTVCALALLVATWAPHAAAVSLCTSNGARMCVNTFSDGRFTMYPTDMQDSEFAHVTYQVVRIEEFRANGDPEPGHLVTGLRNCVGSTRSTDAGGAFASTTITCATTGGVTSASVTFLLRDAVESFNIDVGGQQLTVPQGGVKLDMEFTWPDPPAGTAAGRRMSVTARTSWSVPTTLEELWGSQYSSIPSFDAMSSLPDTVVSDSVEEGSIAPQTTVRVDGMSALHMTVPHRARICAAAAAAASSACWRNFDEVTVEEGGAAVVGAPLVDAASTKFPEFVTVTTSWTGLGTTMSVDPIFTMSQGQLGGGDVDVRLVIIGAGAVLLCLFCGTCCALYRCCCTHKKRKHRNRGMGRRVAPAGMAGVVPGAGGAVVNVAPAAPGQQAVYGKSQRVVRVAHVAYPPAVVGPPPGHRARRVGRHAGGRKSRRRG